MNDPFNDRITVFSDKRNSFDICLAEVAAICGCETTQAKAVLEWVGKIYYLNSRHQPCYTYEVARFKYEVTPQNGTGETEEVQADSAIISSDGVIFKVRGEVVAFYKDVQKFRIKI